MKNIIYLSNNHIENQLGSAIAYRDHRIYLNGHSIYAIDSSFTIRSHEVGDICVTLCKNGNAIRKAKQSIADGFATITIPAIIQTCGEVDELSVKISEGAEVESWSAMVVEV